MNAEQASKNAIRKPTRQKIGEGCQFQGKRAERCTLDFRRGSGDSMHTRGRSEQHGKPFAWSRRKDQPESGDGQAGRDRVTERLVVPWKPGNSGGGKEP